jgi:hypothetical protein
VTKYGHWFRVAQRAAWATLPGLCLGPRKDPRQASRTRQLQSPDRRGGRPLAAPADAPEPRRHGPVGPQGTLRSQSPGCAWWGSKGRATARAPVCREQVKGARRAAPVGASSTTFDSPPLAITAAVASHQAAQRHEGRAICLDLGGAAIRSLRQDRARPADIGGAPRRWTETVPCGQASRPASSPCSTNCSRSSPTRQWAWLPPGSLRTSSTVSIRSATARTWLTTATSWP